jgi:hypothetical protein
MPTLGKGWRNRPLINNDSRFSGFEPGHEPGTGTKVGKRDWKARGSHAERQPF